MSERFPRGVCCHEADHAVVGWSLGLRVSVVSVVSDDESGHTRFMVRINYRAPDKSLF